MFSNLPNLKLVHKWALAYFCSPGNTAHRCVHFKLCWGCQCTGLWLCYHSRADSTQEVSFRTQTPSDPEHQGTSIFARLHPSTTSCISFPKRFSQHGTKWEKRLGPRAPKIHCIEASWKATCVYSSKEYPTEKWGYYWGYYHDCHENILISPAVLNHHLQLKVKKNPPFGSGVFTLFHFIIYAVSILKFMVFNSLSTFVQLYISFLLIYVWGFFFLIPSVK